jgi:hypothetical protein
MSIDEDKIFLIKSDTEVLSDYKSTDDENNTRNVDTPVPKKVKKKRPPMSTEQKTKLLERLKKGRDTAKRNRNERKRLKDLEQSETLRMNEEMRNELNTIKKERKSSKHAEPKKAEPKNPEPKKPEPKPIVLLQTITQVPEPVSKPKVKLSLIKKKFWQK